LNKSKRRNLGIKKARRILRIFRERSYYFHNNGDLLELYNEGGLYERGLIKTRVPCSCNKCGNRRKYMGKTFQEKKADLFLSEDMVEHI
jgi:hypothetical protein